MLKGQLPSTAPVDLYRTLLQLVCLHFSVLGIFESILLEFFVFDLEVCPSIHPSSTVLRWRRPSPDPKHPQMVPREAEPLHLRAALKEVTWGKCVSRPWVLSNLRTVV